tara:strand:+ start:485 stop:1351 length:867 start_codon:yes stop_codon:yes gene_type:complete
VPIRTLPSRAIADASIQAVDIASDSISKAKIDADTRLGLQNDSIILDGTDGAGANKGDFLVLDGTDNSSTNANDRILFDETFLDKIGLFNINTLGSGGQALKVNSAGSAFEFGAAGTFVKLATASASSSSEIAFDNTVFTSTYKSYMIRINDFVLSTNANFYFADSPDNGSTFSFTSSQGNHYAKMGSAAISGSGGTNTNLHSFEGWVHDATGTVKTNFVELHLPYFTQVQVNKLYYAKYMHQNNNGIAYMNDFGWESSLTSAMNYIKFYGASGNITKGEFTVYGILE